jgi:hypothetical protein
MTEENSEFLHLENLIIQGEMSKRIIVYLYNNKIEKFDTSLLESEFGFNSASHYKIMLRLEKIKVIKKVKMALHNKNLYEIIDKIKLEELAKKIAEKL